MVLGKGYIDTGIGLNLSAQEKQEYINQQVERQQQAQDQEAQEREAEGQAEQEEQETNIEVGLAALFGPKVQCDFVFKDGIEATITRYLVEGYTCEEWRAAVKNMTSTEYLDYKNQEDNK